METPKLQGKYDTGQLILHRVFGYRGVILFPWLARVYDRDIPTKQEGYATVARYMYFSHNSLERLNLLVIR